RREKRIASVAGELLITALIAAFVERDFPVPHVLTLVCVGAWVIAMTWMIKQRWLRWLRDDFANEVNAKMDGIRRAAPFNSTCQVGKYVGRLPNMESKQAPAARSEAGGARDALARRIVTPSWLFSSIGAAIAAQIAMTAVGFGIGSPWLVIAGQLPFAAVA